METVFLKAALLCAVSLLWLGAQGQPLDVIVCIPYASPSDSRVDECNVAMALVDTDDLAFSCVEGGSAEEVSPRNDGVPEGVFCSVCGKLRMERHT